MTLKMTQYLGRHVSNLLQSDPFKNWVVERSVEEDLEEPIVDYVFKGRGLTVECDGSDTVCTVFVNREECDGFRLSEIPFTLSRKEVLDRLGVPARSGEKSHHPFLGEYGAWDRFAHADFTIHIQYTIDACGIKMITLMLNDVVP